MRRRDRYGSRPGKLGSLIGALVTMVLLGAVFVGLLYATLNFPFTLLWVFLMIVLAFGALVGGLPTVLGDIVVAWSSDEDDGLEGDEEP